MIRLTRLNKKPLMVNSDLIKFIENAPDTVITLVTGEKIVVREKSEEVLAQILDFRRRVAPDYHPHVVVLEPPAEQDTDGAEVSSKPPGGVERGQE